LLLDLHDPSEPSEVSFDDTRVGAQTASTFRSFWQNATSVVLDDPQ
jgi:hypothetical protein